jgi:hypothetical protein
MYIQPNQRKEIYDKFCKVYRSTTGSRLTWATGEKKRAVAIFVKIAAALELKDNEFFDRVFEMYGGYLEQYARQWACWKGAHRGNYVGFLDKKENISIFVNRALDVHVDKKIAGVHDAESWDF